MVDEVDVERCLLFLLLNIGSLKKKEEKIVVVITDVNRHFSLKQTNKQIAHSITHFINRIVDKFCIFSLCET